MGTYFIVYTSFSIHMASIFFILIVEGLCFAFGLIKVALLLEVLRIGRTLRTGHYPGDHVVMVSCLM